MSTKVPTHSTRRPQGRDSLFDQLADAIYLAVLRRMLRGISPEHRENA